MVILEIKLQFQPILPMHEYCEACNLENELIGCSGIKKPREQGLYEVNLSFWDHVKEHVMTMLHARDDPARPVTMT